MITPFLLSRSGATRPAELWIAPDGNDTTGNGTPANPLLSLDGARIKARTIVAADRVGGVVATFKPGNYPLAAQVRFDVEDSGQLGRPITYRAQVPGTVIFDGGKMLTGWSLLASGDVYNALPVGSRGNVYVCDLNALGITEAMLGTFRLAGTINGIGSVGESMLTCKDAPMVLAQYPKLGLYLPTVAGVTTFTPAGADEARVKTWTHAITQPANQGIQVGGFMKYQWAYNRMPASINTTTGLVTLSQAPDYGDIATGMRYKFLNVLEELSTPGEYYIDRTTLKLYFYPPAGVTPAELETGCHLSCLDADLIYTNQCHDLVFDGLVLQGSRKSAVTERGIRMTWKNCKIRNCTLWGIYFNERVGTDNTVKNCELYNLGAGGIWSKSPYNDVSPPDDRSPRMLLSSSRHLFQNNHIHDYGLVDRSSVLGIKLVGVGHTVRHNHFGSSTVAAVGFAGNDHVIEWNLVDGVMTETADGGSIYSGRDLSYRGNVIRYNKIINILGDTAMTYPEAHGIYLDDRLSGTTVESNFIGECWGGIYVAGGRDNLITNNVFLNNGQNMRLGDRGDGTDYNDRKAQLTAVMGSPIGSSPDEMYVNNPYSKYPRLLDILLAAGTSNPLGNQTMLSPRRNVITRNIGMGAEAADTDTGSPWLQETPSSVVGTYSETCNYYRADNYYGATPDFVNFPTSLETVPGGNADDVLYQPWDISIVGNYVGDIPPTPASFRLAGTNVTSVALWVDPNGSNINAGDVANPLQTLSAAIAKARAIPSYEKTNGVTITLKDGTYPSLTTTQLIYDDRGTSGGKMLIKAEHDGLAILDGSRALTGWTLLAAGAAYNAIPATARANVYVCDLLSCWGLANVAAGLAIVGNMIRLGWSEGNSVAPPAWFVFDGALMPLASSKNPVDEWLLTTTPASTTTFISDHEPAQSYSFPAVDPDFYVHGYWGNEFVDEMIACTVQGDGTVTLANAPYYAIPEAGNTRYRFVNVIEELDSPGEWYLDRTTMKLYVYLPTGAVAADLETKASLTYNPGSIIEFYNGSAHKGADLHMKLEGLVIQGARSQYAMVRGLWQPGEIDFTTCTIRATNRVGVTTNGDEPGVWPKSWRFSRCTFRSIGHSGIYLFAGNRVTLTSGVSSITNCAFSDIGAIRRTYSPAISLVGVGTQVKHNTFTDLPHMAIGLSGNNHLIEYNHFLRCVTDSADAGAVYGGNDWTMCGNIIRRNKFQDFVLTNVSSGTDPLGHSIVGVYLDDGWTGCSITSNLFTNVHTGIQLNGGRDIDLSNNVFHQVLREAHKCGDWLQWLSNGDARITRLYANLAAMPYTNAAWKAAYPWLENILTDDPKHMKRNTASGSVLINMTRTLTTSPVPPATYPPTVYSPPVAELGRNGTWFVGATYYPPTTNVLERSVLWFPSNYYGNSPGFTNFPTSLAIDTGGNADLAGFIPWDISLVGIQP